MEIRLYPPQRRALMTPATEVLYGGALGGGKSYLARVASIIFSVEIPGLITYLFRRQFKEVLANHIYTPGGYLEMMSDLMKAGDVTYNKADYAFSFWNGSRIQLAHSNYESDIFSHQGAQIQLLIIDEATHFTPDMLRFIRTRLRLGGLQIPDKWKGMFPRILYTANPGGVAHHYFKSGFVDVGAGKLFHAADDDGGMLREYVPAKLTDNRVLLDNDPDYAKRVMGLGETNYSRAMLEGDWDMVTGGAFNDIWDGKTHVVDPFPIPREWRIDRAFDYGSSAPAAIGWFVESDGDEYRVGDKIIWAPKGTLFQIGELYLADKNKKGLYLTPREIARRVKVKEFELGYSGRVYPGPADNSIFHAEPGKPSIYSEIHKEGISFTTSDKSPGSRILGLALMRQRLYNTKHFGRERPGIYFFKTCPHSIRTLPNLERDKKNIEDIDTKQEDHIWDVVRYRLLKAYKTPNEARVYGT